MAGEKGINGWEEPADHGIHPMRPELVTGRKLRVSATEEWVLRTMVLAKMPDYVRKAAFSTACPHGLAADERP